MSESAASSCSSTRHPTNCNCAPIPPHPPFFLWIWVRSDSTVEGRRWNRERGLEDERLEEVVGVDGGEEVLLLVAEG